MTDTKPEIHTSLSSRHDRNTKPTARLCLELRLVCISGLVSVMLGYIIQHNSQSHWIAGPQNMYIAVEIVFVSRLQAEVNVYQIIYSSEATILIFYVSAFSMGCLDTDSKTCQRCFIGYTSFAVWGKNRWRWYPPSFSSVNVTLSTEVS